jgi:hypothetical protein
MSSYLTVILYNGLCNRLLPIVSALRLAKKCNKKTNLVWTYTPQRSCLSYFGDFCKYEDLFLPVDGMFLELDIKEYEKVYEFYYWLNLDLVVDINIPGNININYALYPLICNEDNSDIFKNFKKTLNLPGELIFDEVGKEIADEMKKSIVPIPELQNEIDSCVKNFFSDMIGIHIRKSDGGFKEYDWNSIIKKLIKNCKEWTSSSNNRGIFLATDDQDVYIEFASKLGHKLIFYNPPDKLCNCVSSSKFNNDKYNVLTAVVEMYLLGKCNKMIIGTVDSTFSICGMMLGENDVLKYLINTEESVPEFKIN